MAINYGLLRNVTAREIIAALRRDGFSLDRSDGSQRIYYKDGRRVTVAYHGGGGTFAQKTLKSMIVQAVWTEDDLRRLGLIR